MENNKISSQIPTGIIIILVIIGISIATIFFSLFKTPLVPFGYFTIHGFEARLIQLLMLFILGISFYGIREKFKWSRKLIIGYYLCFFILQALINASFLLLNKDIYYNKYLENLPSGKSPLVISELITADLLGFALTVIIGFSIVFYIYRKKDFFVK